MTDYRQEAAQRRMEMRGASETRMVDENQQNAGGEMRRDLNGVPYYDSAPLSEYPRMMYRKTDVEQIQPFADEIVALKDAPMVINRYNGFLCETTIAHSIDEAEILSENGWDTSPAAAYGVSEGMAAQTSAKDERIAELEAMLAAQNPASDEGEGYSAPRRGRPPKALNE